MTYIIINPCCKRRCSRDEVLGTQRDRELEVNSGRKLLLDLLESSGKAHTALWPPKSGGDTLRQSITAAVGGGEYRHQLH
jgi:hypothetical protein